MTERVSVNTEWCDLVMVRNIPVDEHTWWMWPKSDIDGAFQAIMADWLNGHRDMFLDHTFDRRMVCVQAGGCCGMYPRLLSDYFDRVYTFEPDPLNFYCLTNNCQKDNIYKFQMGLGSKATMANILRRFPHNPGGHQLIQAEGRQTIPVLPLDSFHFDRVDFIQLDVEGAEFDVLQGARRTIHQFAPVISVERTNKEIEWYLHGFGYHAAQEHKEDTLYKR